MAPLRFFLRLVGVLLLVLGASSALSYSVEAQDRSVPRFGPLVEPDTVKAGRFDLGRLWSMAQPPLDYFEEQYDVRANERGLRHVRRATVRLPECSGALVSPQGLVVTAARCVRPFLPTGAGDSLRASGFYADEQLQERRLPGLSVEQTVAIEEVTATVDSVAQAAGAKDGETPRWQEGMTTVEQRRQREADDDRRIEVVREAGGTRYVAYTYRRYEDVRLAFFPDRSVTGAGRLGEPLTYPQHAWDVAVLRIYDEETPLQSAEHVDVQVGGVRPGDAVFAVGHPSDVKRATTAEQLAFRREVQLPARLSNLEAAAVRYRQYVDTSATAGEAWTDRARTVQATLRHTRARLESLQNEYVKARLQRRDQQLRRGEETRNANRLIDQLAAIQDEKRSLASDYRAFSFLLQPEHSSATLRRAMLAYRVQEGDTASFGSVEEALKDVPSQPHALDAAALAAHARHLQVHLGADSTLVRVLPDSGLASSLVRNSVFSAPEEARARIQKNDLPEEDPVLALVEAFYGRYADFRKARASLRTREKRLTDSLARVRHRAVDLPVTLPQARSLRISDGRIRGYSHNGTLAPAFTTFYGLYGRHYALRSDDSGELPGRWRTPSDAFKRSTPLTTVASTDMGGGIRGGPLLSTSLELVGIVFDGNVQSAAGEYLFLPRRMRTVAVDVRGLIEGLRSVYEAERLVTEMTDGPASQ